MLTTLDDSPWHQLPTTFDHVGTSDPRFFDRLWFAASDRLGGQALQFTMGVYQNMNVLDGGVVVIAGGRQHNLRVSRSLRPRYASDCGPLSLEVREPMKRLGLSVAPNSSGLSAELEWVASDPPQEERPHFARLCGRILEDYSRYDQIGTCRGWFEVDGARHEVDSWWSCRDHSWGVRERVGIPEPVTGPPETTSQGGGLFAFLFYSTPDYAGHVQVTRRAEGLNHSTVEIIDRSTGVSALGSRSGSTRSSSTTSGRDGWRRRPSTCTCGAAAPCRSRPWPWARPSRCRGWATAATTTGSGSGSGAASSSRKATSGTCRIPLVSAIRMGQWGVRCIASSRYASGSGRRTDR